MKKMILVIGFFSIYSVAASANPKACITGDSGRSDIYYRGVEAGKRDLYGEDKFRGPNYDYRKFPDALACPYEYDAGYNDVFTATTGAALNLVDEERPAYKQGNVDGAKGFAFPDMSTSFAYPAYFATLVREQLAARSSLQREYNDLYAQGFNAGRKVYLQKLVDAPGAMTFEQGVRIGFDYSNRFGCVATPIVVAAANVEFKRGFDLSFGNANQLQCQIKNLESRANASGGGGFYGGCDAGQHRESYLGDCVPDANASGG